MQISRESTYTDLQKLLMKEMSPILHDDILISAQKVPLFKMRVLDGFGDVERVYLDPLAELPLYMDCVETALNLSQVIVLTRGKLPKNNNRTVQIKNIKK